MVILFPIFTIYRDSAKKTFTQKMGNMAYFSYCSLKCSEQKIIRVQFPKIGLLHGMVWNLFLNVFDLKSLCTLEIM